MHMPSSFVWNETRLSKKGKGKVQGVPQSQAAALHRHQEEEEIEQMNEKH